MSDACWADLAAGFKASAAGASVEMAVAALAILGLPMAVVLAPLLQRAYRRRVQRTMHMREVAEPPPAWWARRQRQHRQAAADAPAGTAPPLAEAMQLRMRRIRRATLAAFVVYVLGTLAVAPLMEDMGPLDVVLAVAFVAVTVAGPMSANVNPEGSKWTLLVGVSLFTALVIWLEGKTELGDAVIGLLIIVLVHFTSVHRTLRAVVVPLLVLSAGAMVGLVGAAIAISPFGCLGGGADPATYDWRLGSAALALGALVVVLGVWASARLLEGIARIVRRGWMSELSLMIAVGLALLAGVLVLAIDDPRITLPAKDGLFLAWMGLTAAAYVLVLRALPRPAGARTLLVLRVFSRDRRAERLLDALQARWQLAGPVLEIGGPDLVALNLDLQEFVAFVNFRLHELFQPAGVSAEQLAASLDMAPDREGRFRINELFCFDTSWRRVVDQLIGLADVVLLDLRGFNPQRQGTAHEVGRLAELGALPRVVAITDAATDWALVEQALRRHGGDPQALRRVDAAGRGAMNACLEDLLRLADAAPGRSTTPAAPLAAAQGALVPSQAARGTSM